MVKHNHMAHFPQPSPSFEFNQYIGQGAIRVGDFKLMFAPHFNKDGWYNPDAKPRKMRMVVSLMVMVVMLLMMMVVVMVMAIVMMMVMVVCLVKIALARRRDVGVLSHHMKILALRFYWRRNEINSQSLEDT